MKVVEIFDSIDGEGIRTGQPCSFIRLAGCNLRCTYCDTLYALFGEDEECVYTEMSIDEIMSKVNPLYKRITLTGGEPIIHKDADKLTAQLLNAGYEVNIETNGAADISEFLKKMPENGKLFFTIDYKLPSSGMSDKMRWDNFLALRPCDVIKYVAGSEEDVKLMVEITKKLTEHYKVMPHIFVGAVYGSYDLQRLTETVLKEPCLKDARIQVQLHKIIWDPNKKGV